MALYVGKSEMEALEILDDKLFEIINICQKGSVPVKEKQAKKANTMFKSTSLMATMLVLMLKIMLVMAVLPTPETGADLNIHAATYMMEAGNICLYTKHWTLYF